MLKMAFPGAKDMNEALGKMQNMMQGMQGMQGKGGGMAAAMNAMAGQMGGSRGGPRPAAGMKLPPGGGQDQQLKAAMDMLQKMQKNKR